MSLKQVPLERAARHADLGAAERERLAWIPEILRFARDELGLEPGSAYTTYLDTGGEPVSHLVCAAHPLSVAPYRWRFPIAGTVAYKGYFDEADARAEKDRLEALGFEAVVLPVDAFSTLGWLSDPVLSTMLRLEVPELADLLIHETTHRTMYFTWKGETAAGATALNESLASHIACEGTVRFLESHPELLPLLPAYRKRAATARRIDVLLERLRAELAALYASALPDEEKLARKAEIFATASAARRRLSPDGAGGELPASNALIAAWSSYHRHRDEFAEIEKRLGGGLRALIELLKALPRDRNPLAEAASRLTRTASRGPPG
jgi:predicted aminopeptidase